MKNPVINTLILFLLVLGSCENGRHADGNQSEDRYQNNATTGTLSGTDKADGTISQDTTLPGPTHTRILAELPGKVVEEILTNIEFRNQELTNWRSYEEENKIYYELTFDNQAKVTFDSAGNRRDKQ